MATYSPPGSAGAGASLEPRLQSAVNEVLSSFGDTVSVAGKAKSLRKFGERLTLGTSYETIAGLQGAADETYVSTNAITSIVSSSASDTTDVKVEYHTISGNDLTFGVQTVTLTGQTPVTLGTACARVSRIYNVGAVDFVGSIVVYEGGAVTAGVPDSAAEVHAQIEAGQNTTRKLATSVSSTDYLFITEVVFTTLDGSNLETDYILETKATDGVWLPKFEVATAVQGLTTFAETIDPVIIVAKNTDVRVRAKMTSGSADVSGKFSGYLAAVL